MVNIVEIVNKLPIGTKLYSTICGECTIKKIYEGLGFDVISKDGTTYNFSYDGRFNLNGECCIFPSKENRDWNTFIKVEIPFEPKIGDVVADCCDNVFIYQGKYSEYSDNANFVVFTTFHNDFFVTEGNVPFQLSKAVRYATANEKDLLFDIMNKNGYVYNELNNCISKKEETKRKFKVGDKIIEKLTSYPILTIIYANSMIYSVKDEDGDEYDIGVKIVENNYKIATFSPKDLKPFDKLLVKRHNAWQIAHFGYFKNGVVFTEMGQPCNIDVVPYNDETKHLIGTCDNYDGFYKWWD